MTLTHFPAQIAQLSQEFDRMATNDKSVKTDQTAEKKDENSVHSDSEGQDPSRECCICLQNVREIAFVPCGHTLCCRACSKKLKECPVCRKRVMRRLKIFFS
jgi:baculoviral IAP repeat-containing protein 7/8